MRHLTSDAVTEVKGMELKADEEGAPALVCYRNVETPNMTAASGPWTNDNMQSSTDVMNWETLMLRGWKE
jgi:hypothetical protein